MQIRKKSMENAITHFVLNENIKISECAKKFNVDVGTLKSHLKQMNIDTNRYKYSFNENYFETIDTEEKAYWLGFILADGSISIKKNQLSIGLAEIDSKHLEKFKSDIDSNNPLHYYNANNNVTNKKYPTVELDLVSKKLLYDLEKLNIVPNKSKNEQPTYLRDDLIKHYIRGFFDGDGWITSSKRRLRNGNYGNTLKWEFGFGSSFDMTNYISEHFNEKLNIEYKEPKLNCIFKLRYSNKNDIAKIIDYLYEDAHIYLNRKYEKIKDYCRLESKLQKTQDD